MGVDVRPPMRGYDRNPEYTGYMVWNRRGRNSKRGRHNPPNLWVWSKETSHEALVSLDTYRAADDVASGRRIRARPTESQRTTRQGHRSALQSRRSVARQRPTRQDKSRQAVTRVGRYRRATAPDRNSWRSTS